MIKKRVIVQIIVLITALTFVYLFLPDTLENKSIEVHKTNQISGITGNVILPSEVNANGVYYLSPNGNDANSGSVSAPWKTMTRAFNVSLPVHVTGGSILYLKEGIHRFDLPSFFEASKDLNIDGTATKRTLISSAIGERAKIYLSENITGWTQYSGNIYYVNWRSYLQTNKPWYYQDDWRSKPQGVYLEGDFPVKLQQVNNAKTGVEVIPSYARPASVRNDQNDMIAGDFYYETDVSSTNYGRLFVWLPENKNPNQESVEVSLDYSIAFSSNYTIFYNLTIRYAADIGWAGLGVNGRNNIIDGVDSSYNSFSGLGGRCENCIVSNSVFNFNGNSGSDLVGSYTIYENNTFDSNNWRRYSGSWHCGGIKLINNDYGIWKISNMTIRGNTFKNTYECIALWFDWMGEGQVIEYNLFINNSAVDLTMEATNGTISNPNIIRNNFFLKTRKDNRANTDWLPSALTIFSSHYNQIYNNVFFDSATGIVMNSVSGQESERELLQNNRATRNIFVNVTNPVSIIPESGNGKVINNSADYNVFWQSGHDMGNNGNVIYCTNYGACMTPLSTWQVVTGNDLHSVEGDPKFINLDGYNFSLKISSPAIPLGIIPIDQGIIPGFPAITNTFAQSCNEDFICQVDENQDGCAFDCSPNLDTYYISTDGADNNPGDISRPWKSIERAFNSSKPNYVNSTETLYLREGVYRTDQVGFDEVMKTASYNGTSSRPTIVTSYPGEKARIYMSENVTGWIPYTGRTGTNIYYVNWSNYLRTNHHEFYDGGKYAWANNPQAVFVDDASPVMLQQVNALKTSTRETWMRPLSLRTNQLDMIAGDFYYENDPTSTNYGKLFIWLPDNSNPNTRKMEIPLSFNFAFVGEYLRFENLTLRYSEEPWGFAVGGKNNVISGIDSSYNAYTGLDGQCYNCTVKNSAFRWNGNTGSNLKGYYTTYDNDTFDYSNFRKFPAGSHCGGIKLHPGIEGVGKLGISNMTIRNSVFSNTFACVGLWFDWMEDGQLIENNLFINNKEADLILEVTEGTKDNPNIVRNNIFMNTNKPGRYLEMAPIMILLSSSTNTYIYNNLFYNSTIGVTMARNSNPDGKPGTEFERIILQNNKVFNNIFVNITAPLIIVANSSDHNSENNTADYNIFWGGNVDEDLALWPTAGWELSDGRIAFCRWAGDCNITLADWRIASGNDVHSVVANPLLKNVEEHDFTILDGSPAIDTGITLSEVPKDVLGIVRPRGSRYDIGPYESEFSRCIQNGQCEATENQDICPVDCSPNLDTYYISTTGADNNPGDISRPWKSIERAFNSSKPNYVQGGETLYLREGIYRLNDSDSDIYPFGADAWNYNLGSVSGTENNPTTISSYPGERAVFYLSEKMTGWTQYSGNIYSVDWNNYIKNKYPVQYNNLINRYYADYPSYKDYGYSPQLVAIDESNPVLLQQVNSAKTAVCANINCASWNLLPNSVKTNQNDMIEGDFYYETDKNSANYGKLFIWLPDGNNPNTKNIEVGLAKSLIFNATGLILQNMTFRYAGGSVKGFWEGVIGLIGSDNIADGLDVSYNDYGALGGSCTNCIVKNSNLSFNGNVGSTLSGNNTIYENNTISGNNYRIYDSSGSCGGVKFFSSGLENSMIFRGNTLEGNVKCPAVWFDTMGYGHNITNNIIKNNSYYGIMVEVSSGTAENPILIEGNTLEDNGAYRSKLTLSSSALDLLGSSWEGGVYISASNYVYVRDNKFTNLPGGVFAHGLVVSDPLRRSVSNNRITNNTFINVSFPITLPVTSNVAYRRFSTGYDPNSFDPDWQSKLQVSAVNDVSDCNVFYGTGQTYLWNSLGFTGSLLTDLESKHFLSVDYPGYVDSNGDGLNDYGISEQLPRWQSLYGFDLHSRVAESEEDAVKIGAICQASCQNLQSTWINGIPVSINSQCNNNVNYFRNNTIASGMNWFFGSSQNVTNNVDGSGNLIVDLGSNALSNEEDKFSGKMPAVIIPPYVPPVYNKEIWIDDRDDGIAGDGSKNNPYDGSSADKFDAILRAIWAKGYTNVHVNLMEGNFETKGTDNSEEYREGGPLYGWYPLDGWNIEGAGMYRTTIKLVEPRVKTAEYNQIIVNRYTGTNIRVADLTIDGNMPYDEQITTVNCISLVGEEHRIERVRAIHCGGGQYEGFPINIVSNNNYPSTGNYILNNIVENSSGKWSTAINLGHNELNDARTSGIVAGNIVKNIHSNGGGYDVAYGGFGIKDVIYYNNLAENIDGGFIHDSLNASGVVIRNNLFINISSYGFNIGGGHIYYNYTIVDNYISLGKTAQGIFFNGNVVNSTVEGNIIDYADSANPLDYGRLLPDTIVNLLKHKDLVNNEVIEAIGYRRLGDDGQGQFIYDAYSTEKIDNGTVFALDYLPGRLKRVLPSGVDFDVYAEWFGAYGDGAHDDQKAINNALDKFKRVKLLDKTYGVAGRPEGEHRNPDGSIASDFWYPLNTHHAINLESNYKIEGSNSERSRIKLLDGTNPMGLNNNNWFSILYNRFYYESAENVIIRNLTLDGNFNGQDKKTTIHLAQIRGGSPLVENVNFRGYGTGRNDQGTSQEAFVLAQQLVYKDSSSSRIGARFRNLDFTSPGSNGDISGSVAEITHILISGANNFDNLGWIMSTGYDINWDSTNGGENNNNWWPAYGGIVENITIRNIVKDSNQKSPLNGITVADVIGAEIKDNAVLNFDGNAIFIMSWHHNKTRIINNNFTNVMYGVVLNAVNNGVTGQAYQKPYHENVTISNNAIVIGTDGHSTTASVGAGVQLYGEGIDGAKRFIDITIQNNTISESGYPTGTYPNGIILQMLSASTQKIIVVNNTLDILRYNPTELFPEPNSRAIVYAYQYFWQTDKPSCNVIFLRNKNSIGVELFPLIAGWDSKPVEWDKIESSCGLSGDISSCKAIDKPGVYTLSNDISSTGTCLIISTQNVTINGNGKKINFGSAGTGIGVDVQNGAKNISISNISIINTGSTYSNNYGIILSQVSYGTIYNSTVYTNGAGANNNCGISLSNSNNVSIVQNKISSNPQGQRDNGICISSSNNNSILYNEINVTRNAVSLSVSNENVILYNNIRNINPVAVSSIISVDNSAYGTKIAYNNISVLGNDNPGISLTNSNNASVYANNITGYGTGTIGLIFIGYVSKFSNINDNLLLAAGVQRVGISFVAPTIYTSSSIVEKNNFNVYGGKEITFDSTNIDDIMFIDQPLTGYTLKGRNLSFIDSNYGSIKLIGIIDSIGKNLSSDIKILQNFVQINSSKTGLNSPANITLNNLPGNFLNPVILRNNSLCTDCYNFTSLNSQIVKFNISRYGNYSIGEMPYEYAPNVSLLKENPASPAVYSPNGRYEFNATVIDVNGVDSVLLEFNGKMYNSSVNENRFNVSFYNLNAGTYTYRWFANDSKGNMNNSEAGSYIINKVAQTISIGTISNIKFGETFNLGASSSVGLPVSFRVVSGDAQIVGNVLTANNTGSVSIEAYQNGDGNYDSAVSETRTFSVGKADAVVTLSNLLQVYDGNAKQASASSVPVTAIDISYDGLDTLPVNAGSYDIIATINNITYQGSASGTLVIGKASQTITFGVIPDKKVGDSFDLSASSTSGLPVSFRVVSGLGSISGIRLTINGPGAIVVEAYQNGDGNYDSATPVQQTINSICNDGFTPVGDTCVVTCTGFEYTIWGVCSVAGSQTRNVVTSIPNGCTAGTPDTSMSCTRVCTPDAVDPLDACDNVDNGIVTGYKDKCNVNGTAMLGQNTCAFTCNTGFVPVGDKCVVECTDANWQFTLDPVVCPFEKIQTKAWTKIGTCTAGVQHPASEQITCDFTAPICTSFTYSEWSICDVDSKTRTKTITSKLPEHCEGGVPEPLSETCIPIICTANEEVACSAVPNGIVTGYVKKCSADGTAWLNDNPCTLTGCNAGYNKVGDACYLNQAPSVTLLTATPASPVVYSPAGNYIFGATITDDGVINNVKFEFNGTNYSSTNTGNVYSVNLPSLSFGTYSYQWYSNDTNGKVNNSEADNYVVNRAQSSAQLYLNNTRSGMTIYVGSSVLLNATPLLGEGKVNITLNDILVKEGIGKIEYLASFDNIGTSFIRASYGGTQNYTYSSEGFSVIVLPALDTIAPNVTLLKEYPPVSATYSSNSVYQFNASIIDDTALDKVIFWFGGDNYTAVNIAGNIYSVLLTKLSSGTYPYYWYANDTKGNMNNSEAGSYAVNKAIPQGSISGASSINYGTAVNVQGNEINNGDGDVTYNLYRDNVSVNNPDITTLSAGTYVYVYNATSGQNYTINESIGTLALTINQANGVVYLYLNNSRANATIYRYDKLLLNGSLINGEHGYLNLTIDGAQQNYSQTNVTNYYNFTEIGNFKIGLNYSGNENYTGSYEEWNVTVLTSPDAIAPNVNIVYPVNPSYNSVINELNYTVYDINLQICKYSLDDGVSNTTLACGNNVSGLTSNQGSNSWTVYAMDSFGNENSSKVEFFVDSISPKIKFEIPTDIAGSTLNRDYIIINISADDVNLKNITIFVRNSTDIVYNVTSDSSPLNYTASALRDGTYFVEADAYDLYGNVNNTDTNIYTISSDSIAPNVFIIEPASSSDKIYSSEGINVNVSLSEPGIVNYSFDNGINNYSMNANASNTGFTHINSSIAEGSYVLQIYARDMKGNKNNSVYRTISVDRTAPDVMYGIRTSADGSQSSIGSIFVNISSNSADVKIINISLYNSSGLADNSFGNTNSYSHNFIRLPSGIYRFNASIEDFAGNLDYTGIRSVTIIALPLVQGSIVYGAGTSADNSVLISNSIYVNVSAQMQQESSIRFELFNSSGLANQSVYTNAMRTINWTGLQPGTYKYNVTISNSSANLSSATRTITLSSGAVSGPLIIVHSPANITYGTRNILINMSVSSTQGISRIWFANDTGNTTYTSAIIQNTSVGSHTWRFYSNDSANKVSSLSVTFNINLTQALICSPDETLPCTPVSRGVISGYSDKCNGQGSAWLGQSTCTVVCDEGYSLSGGNCVEVAGGYKTILYRPDLDVVVDGTRKYLYEKGTNNLLAYLDGSVSEQAITNITIVRNNLTAGRGFLMVHNLTLANSQFKALVFSPRNTTSDGVCLRDASDVSTLSQIDSVCSKIACPGVRDQYSCIRTGTGAFIVSGLRYSGVTEKKLYCGDNYCSSSESCSSCSIDCGSCSSGRSNPPIVMPPTGGRIFPEAPRINETPQRLNEPADINESGTGIRNTVVNIVKNKRLLLYIMEVVLAMILLTIIIIAFVYYKNFRDQNREAIEMGSV